MRKALALLMIVCVLVGACPVASAAGAGPTAEFTLKQDGSYYWLELSASDLTFNVFQFALNFDPKEFTLVDEKGKASDLSEDYQEDLTGGLLSWVGCKAENAKGYFTFCGFLMPGQKKGPNLNQEGNRVIAGKEALPLCRFRLKKTGTVKTGFSIATDKTGLAYNEAFPEGAAFVGGEDLPLTVKFTYPSGQGTNSEVTVDRDAVTPAMTREERLKDTVVMPLDGSNAVVEGKRKPIYASEPTISAFQENSIVFLPVRFVAESLGAKVTWNGKDQSVTVEKNGRKGVMKIGEKTYTINGSTKTASAKALLKKDPSVKDSRTMVPKEFLEDVLQMSIQYDEVYRYIYIAPASAPWDPKRPIEMELTADINLLLSPLVDAAVSKRS